MCLRRLLELRRSARLEAGETLPVNLVVSGLVTEFFGIILFILALLIVRGRVPPTALYLPALLIPQMLLTAGICWFLLLTRTTLSVPSLTGSVMCMGVATANSILMVSFAREQMDEGIAAVQAAVAAGYTRMRPVRMTAFALMLEAQAGPA